jgi:UDP-hydrolysing UDP-N-acetyl-D-glucosamine 2-epimerase
MKPKRVLYISGTRADYGLMKSTLLALKREGFDVVIAVTGMHLMGEFGNTANDIRKDGFAIKEINVTYEQDNRESMARFLGNFVAELTGHVKEIMPDFILVLGDRAEMLGGAIVGAYLYIPVAHVHGGDVTSTIDEFARHAITKLAHIHFPATKKSAERIIKMGEDAWRVHAVGAPGLDEIVGKKYPNKSEMFNKLGLDTKKETLLVLQHPFSIESTESADQMKETMEATKEFCTENNGQCVAIYPNADAGGRKMISVIEDYRKYGFIKIFKNITRDDFLGLMNSASVMIGNSSSGIIEAPSFHLPFVNIGTRQEGRERSVNVIDANYNKDAIKSAITKSIFDKKFRDSLKSCKNPYGEGDSATKIAGVFKTIKIDNKLLQKKIVY